MSRLTLAGGRVLDPGQGIDGPADIVVDDGVIADPSAAAGASCGAEDGADPGRAVVDVTGLIVTPGLIDLHTHLYHGVSHYGVDADTHCLRRGVTTAVDAGSAGAQTFQGLRRYVIERAETRILAFLNIAVGGMITSLVGELEDIRWASAAQAIASARANPDLIVGIKVRLGHQMVGNDPAPAMRLAMEAADALDLPLMVHVIDMRPPISWLLPYLRRGDVVTHCYHGNEGGILDSAGNVLAGVRRARERGVLFDVGHGVGSFAYRVARLGTLAAGREADLTALELREGHWALPDAAGQTEVVERLIVPRLVLRAGQRRHIDSPAPGSVAAGSHAAGPAAAGSRDSGPAAASGQ